MSNINMFPWLIASLLLAAPVAPSWAQGTNALDPTVVQVATGGYHTCALSTAGAVSCWGTNAYGQLGNPIHSGDDHANPLPLEVTDLGSGVAAIAAGQHHACALITTGVVKCWGRNSYGQLGSPTYNGNTNPNPVPAEVAGLSGVVAIVASDYHTCALTTLGAVKCWGDNYYGQLGNPANIGYDSANPAPVDVTDLGSGVVALAAGDHHTCALTTVGAVKCWGDNSYGELGNPSNSGNDNANPVPLDVTGLGSGVAAITAANTHSCALTTAGALKCWGLNLYGQLGNPVNNGNDHANPTPLEVADLGHGVAAVTAGKDHSCALNTAGALKCWGSNLHGQLGNPANNGNTHANPTPLAVTDLGSGVAAIAAGRNHDCALTTAGALKCWGDNSHGELGNPTSNGNNHANPTPRDVTGFVRSVAYAPGAATIGGKPVAVPVNAVTASSKSAR